MGLRERQRPAYSDFSNAIVCVSYRQRSTWLPCVKGAVTVRRNIFGIASNIRLNMCRTELGFSAL